MKNLFQAGKLLLLDMASTFLFLVIYLLTKNIPLSVALGIALGVGQIAWQVTRQPRANDPAGSRWKRVDTMQWLSLFLVTASGTATLLTHDPRFVMIKPSLIYIVVGVVMLKPGWMNRYLPAVAKEVVPDVAVIFGFVWAGLMFFSAALNVFVAVNYSFLTWTAFMSAYATFSKLGLFLIQYTTMRYIGVRRHRQAEMAAEVAVA
ncbi:MAG TPA: septation protein IspZ [Caulobacteraceae bacterium]|jgi:intracellular septation protein A|nr:septation protein IspZ [Caulobacteraceae bacterium]